MYIAALCSLTHTLVHLELRRTLNSLGVTVAAAFLLPRYLLGWDISDTLQVC